MEQQPEDSLFAQVGEMARQDPSFMARLTGLVKNQPSRQKKADRKRSESTRRHEGSSSRHHRSSTKPATAEPQPTAAAAPIATASPVVNAETQRATAETQCASTGTQRATARTQSATAKSATAETQRVIAETQRATAASQPRAAALQPAIDLTVAPDFAAEFADHLQNLGNDSQKTVITDKTHTPAATDIAPRDANRDVIPVRQNKELIIPYPREQVVWCQGGGHHTRLVTPTGTTILSVFLNEKDRTVSITIPPSNCIELD